jgi:8-oxo-dGTP pyrophosphatase MutT (NUDIX family)
VTRPARTTRREFSAGGVVHRGAGDAREVALIRVGDPGRWQLPKGLVEPGEAAERAAIRECREEAGVDGTIERPLGDVEYWYVRSEGRKRVRVHKRVVFYLLRWTGGDVADHDHEVAEAAWVPLEEAPARLAFDAEKDIVRRAAAALTRS